MTPYTSLNLGVFQPGDWFIAEMNSEFQLSGTVGNCLNNFYTYCVVFTENNWLAVKIGNGTLIELRVYVTKMPVSISRVDTTWTAWTYKSQRFTETITYKMTAANRWMELRG